VFPQSGCSPTSGSAAPAPTIRCGRRSPVCPGAQASCSATTACLRLPAPACRIAGARDGIHRPAHAPARHRPSASQLVTASAHSRAQALAAFRAGADLVFLSPLFATRSHPGAATLGPLRFGIAAHGLPGPVVALGGMTPARYRRLRPLGAAGYAGIDCWVG
jgi:hypothetical protein